MAKLMMLAGGIVEPGGGRPGKVSAYVALSSRKRTPTRLFKVLGPTDAIGIKELEGATTIDLGRFQIDLARDLEPMLQKLRARGATASLTTPSASWVCGLVKDHLARTEGLEVES